MNTKSRLSVRKQVLGLIGWLLVTSVAASVGAVATANAKQFYAQLTQPAWAPPGWVFAPVWSTLYALMALAAWLVWRSRGAGESRAVLILFMVQLAANALWSWIFFAWHQGAVAFAEIILLWLLIVVVMIQFWRLKRVAAVLMLPYLLWVTFATALTYAMWKLNAGVLS